MICLLQGYLVVFLEIMCCKIFYEIFCSDETTRRKGKKTKNVIALSISAYGISVLFGEMFFLKEILVIIVTAFMMNWYNKYSFKKNLVISILYQSILLIVDFVAIVVVSMVLINADFTLDTVEVLIVLMAKSVLFFIIVIIKKTFNKKGMEYFDDSQWIKFLIFPMLTIFIIAALIANSSNVISEKQENVFVIIAFWLVGMNIAFFYLLGDVAAKQKQIHEIQLFEVQAKNQLKLYETILASMETQRKISHEYRNQMECIQILCEKEQYFELKDYLKHIAGEGFYDMDCINTNHTIINAVLNAKYQEATKKGVTIICKINDLSNVHMEVQDIVLLLANLFNNAIEACEKCNGKRYIKAKLVCEEEKWILSIKNTYDGCIRYENNTIQTTKIGNRTNHGIGLQNVIHVIEKYKGDYIVEPGEHEFVFSAIIPQKLGIHSNV